jgi:multidrug efflux pump subunit AcrA (membrane-fusion protein)
MLKGSLRDRVRLGPVHFAGLVVVGVAAVATVLFWRGQSGNLADARAARATEVALGPRVQAVAALQGPTERMIQLLADVRPHQNATLYAKVSGYLKAIHVDRGDRVKAGQTIAEVESAETDSQYAAAKADL